MEHFGSDRLGHPLGFAPGLLLGLMIGFAASGHISLNWTAPGAIEMTVAEVAMAQHAAEAQADVHALRRSVKDLVLRIESPAHAAESRRIWQGRYVMGVARLDEFEKRATRRQDRALARMLRAEVLSYDQGVTKVLRMIEDGTIRPASEMGRGMATRAGSPRS